MNRLRKKLEDIGLHDFIHTKKGLGYLLCLKDYLKKTYPVYLLYLLFVLCTFVVLMICQMISDLIIYMLSLYFSIILLYFLLDYRKYRQHHQYLIYLKDNPELFDNLPQESYLEEKRIKKCFKYYKKIFQLKQENQQNTITR